MKRTAFIAALVSAPLVMPVVAEAALAAPVAAAAEETVEVMECWVRDLSGGGYWYGLTQAAAGHRLISRDDPRFEFIPYRPAKPFEPKP